MLTQSPRRHALRKQWGGKGALPNAGAKEKAPRLTLERCGFPILSIAPGPRLPWLRFVDQERATAYHCAVQGCNGLLHVGLVHFHESEPPRAPSLPVIDHPSSMNRNVGGKGLPQILFRKTPGEVSHIQGFDHTFHLTQNPSGRSQTA